MLNGLERNHREGESRERGSALLISLMIMVILTLLGIAYILLAETETQIAVNERNASQALYTAESGARVVIEWINIPVGGFSAPTSAEVDRTLRLLDLDDDGVWETAADGTAGKERYKQTDNLIFQKPYRGTLVDSFLGNEAGPDIRITSGAAFLDTLNDRLLGTGAGTLADPNPAAEYGRIVQIDVYAPPILVVGGTRTRHGVATIKVTAQKVRNIGGTDRVLAERTIKVVLNEINYPAAGGPLQSCTTTDWSGDFFIHWGTATVEGAGSFNITGGGGAFDGKFPSGMPYDTGSPTQYFATLADFNTWYAAANGAPVDDPWYKVLVGDGITNISAACAPGTGSQPCPNAVTPWNGSTDHVNLFQNQGVLAGCPEFDYSLFKTVAQRGGSGIYYYGSYDTGTSTWKEGGLGTPLTFKAATNNKEGFFFFDTADGNPPEHDGVTNECTNCTNALSYTAADQWGTGPDAFIYLNAVSFSTGGGGNLGYTRTLNAPGEPYFDANGDNVYDAGEAHVELCYPGDACYPAGPPNQEAFDPPIIGTGGTRDAKGPDISVDGVIVHGILYQTGKLGGTGNGRFYGAVVAHKIDSGSTIDMWYNESVSLNAWPPPTSPAPKVYISAWEIDRL